MERVFNSRRGPGSTCFNLDPAVGRARVCVCRAGWLGASLSSGLTRGRRQGRPCNDEQQRQAARQRRNRVRSVFTQLVMRKERARAIAHGLLRGMISGQLPDLGSNLKPIRFG
jgi:hypothetical protein